LGWFQELKVTGSDGKTELMRPQTSKGIFFHGQAVRISGSRIPRAEKNTIASFVTFILIYFPRLIHLVLGRG
jgi:hypothetical protein